MRLDKVIEGFMIVRRGRLAATTRANYGYAFHRLAAYFGPERLFPTIGPGDLRAYTDHLRGDGLSERSIHDNLVICSALWTFAQREFPDLGIAHVVRAVEKPKVRDPKIVPFTLDELRALVTAAEWTATWNTSTGKQARTRRATWRRDVALLLVMVDTGLRVSEVCGLNVEDYRRDDGRLHIRHGKGDKERYLFLGDNAQRALWRYVLSRDRLRPTDPLFATRTGKALDRGNVRHTLNRIGANAAVPDVYPHRFRHTFAIQFLRNGGNIFELQRILGHEHLDTVKIYLALAEVDIQRAQRANSPADRWRL